MCSSMHRSSIMCSIYHRVWLCVTKYPVTRQLTATEIVELTHILQVNVLHPTHTRWFKKSIYVRRAVPFLLTANMNYCWHKKSFEYMLLKNNKCSPFYYPLKTTTRVSKCTNKEARERWQAREKDSEQIPSLYSVHSPCFRRTIQRSHFINRKCDD